MVVLDRFYFTLINSLDIDEMQHDAASHQDLHCLLKNSICKGSQSPHSKPLKTVCNIADVGSI